MRLYSMHMDTMHFQHYSQQWLLKERNSSLHPTIMEEAIHGFEMSFSWGMTE